MKVLNYIKTNEPGNIHNIREKELVKAYHVIDLNERKELVNCRLYMGRSKNASTVYCLIWIKSETEWICLSGSAGGYGYDRYSAAVGDALYGSVTLDQSIDYVGSEATKAALIAVAEYFSPGSDTFLIESYA